MQDYKVLIREARTKKGISQGKLATIIGISQPFVAEIESGRKKPSIEVLMKICSALEISLFGETKENE
ncbi:MAG: XRE family transcriptional regulator [Clostridia bacterium]|nr:XRE family transcriptional regulator [Clostridia bacterium]